MSRSAFTCFLADSLDNAAAVVRDEVGEMA